MRHIGSFVLVYLNFVMVYSYKQGHKKRLEGGSHVGSATKQENA